MDQDWKLKLAIDSTQNSGSIALANEERVIYSAYFDIKITHSETLMPAIDYAFKFCNILRSELQEIYVCIGPGSFTGLRIGLATAKGIAFALGIPLYAYSSLELAALPASGLGKNIFAAVDAKMQEVYYAYYDQQLKEIIPTSIATPEELCNLDLEDFILCGSASEMLALRFKNSYNFYTLHPVMKIPSAAGLFSIPNLLPEKHFPQILEELEPLYLREARAQVKKAKPKQ